MAEDPLVSAFSRLPESKAPDEDREAIRAAVPAALREQWPGAEDECVLVGCSCTTHTLTHTHIHTHKHTDAQTHRHAQMH